MDDCGRMVAVGRLPVAVTVAVRALWPQRPAWCRGQHPASRSALWCAIGVAAMDLPAAWPWTWKWLPRIRHPGQNRKCLV